MSAADFAAVRDRLSAASLSAADVMACGDALALLAQQAAASGERVHRVALAGDVTTQLLERAIACAVALEGELPLMYAAPFGCAQQECLDPGSRLHAFEPDVVVLVPDSRHVMSLLPVDASQGEVLEAQQAQVRTFEAMWSALEARGCKLIQHLLVPPPLHWRGLADRKAATSAARRVQALNDALLEAGAARVTWLEADRLAADSGLVAWSSARFYHAGKLAFDPRFLPHYIPWVRGAWRSATGRAKKVLVVDLDDTLWGGTIGDDGLEGIVLGADHGASGEAFAAWQQYLSGLAQRGVVLAACSKNTPEVGATGFDHPASALRRSDFSAFVCNWHDKASGLRRIADELGVGLDAMVFVDENPAERALVRQLAPQVTVVEIDADPARFIERLEAGHWFDLQDYTDADFNRTGAYAARAQAEAGRVDAVDLDSYLASLEMSGRVLLAQAAHLPRLAQLEARTNQFNLTTRRHSQAQLAALLERDDALLLACFLKDRFGDHGLVSSLAAVREGELLRIDSWLMSCRVFSRTAEQFMLAHLCLLARERGLAALSGEYRATPRNAVVADLYLRLGFTAASSDGTLWRRELDAPLDDLACAIAHG